MVAGVFAFYDMKRDFLILDIVFLTAVGVGGATVLGAVIGFIFKDFSDKYRGATLGAAAGVMLSASVFNLIVPALRGGVFSAVLSVLGILFGGVTIDLLDRAVKRIGLKLVGCADAKNGGKRHRAMLFTAAIAIHNLPEGIAAGVGFGGGNTADALMIAGGIALQNIPEGVVLISPMLCAGFSPKKTFVWAALTGVVEVFGTFVGYFAVFGIARILPFALSFAGGCMIYVIFDEMIPSAREGGERVANYSAVLGFCAMILLDAFI